MKHAFKFLISSLAVILCSQASMAQLSFTSNLPIIIIDTKGSQIMDEPKINALMKIIDHGAGNTNTYPNTQYSFDGFIGIEFHGSTSQSFPKKPYGVEVRDASGVSIDASLLGMPKKDDWIFNATYDDKSLMRDVLAYKLGRDQNRYAARTRYFELVLNGEYQGIYALVEKIKRDKNRVNIPKLDPASVSGDALTGGYIIKIDKTTASSGNGWQSESSVEGPSVFFQWEYPKEEDIVQQQKDYIAGYTKQFEKALLADNFRDPVNGYAKYMDVASMVDYMIMNEVTKNVDGYRLSTFMYKKKDSDGGKLFMGPIWDYNLGFGNCDYCTKGNPEGFVTDFNTICSDDGAQIPFWWYKVQKDSTYKRALGARWAQLRNTTFKTSTILTYIDSVSTVLTANGAVDRNFNTWKVLGQYVWPNYYVGNTYQEEVTWLKNWVTDRMEWLDANVPYIISGVNDDPTAFSMSAFPNPFHRDFTIEIAVQKPEVVEIEICDAMGRSVDHRSLSYATAGTYQSVIRLASSAGVFYLKAKLGATVRVEKIIGLTN